MSKTKELNSTYINYFEPGNPEAFGIRLVTLNGKDSKHFYRTDYNTYIPNAISYIIGLMGHWGAKRTKPQRHVFISNKLLAKNIGCSYSHASVVMDQIEKIFKFDVINKRGRGQARKVSISKTFIDFMKVFSDNKLEEFIITHDITSEDRFALQQVYKYNGWGISPGQLSPTQKAQRSEYMLDLDRRDFLHYAYTSNQKPEQRLKYLEKHQDKLTDLEQRQVESIKTVHVHGSKLIHYWFRVLIRIQQRISLVLFKEKQSKETSNIEETSVKSVNQNESTSEAHESATKVAQRLPEDPEPRNDLQFMGRFITSWNIVASTGNVPYMKRLSTERYNTLITLKEEYTESEILKAVRNIEFLNYNADMKYKMDFNGFNQSERFIHALEFNSSQNKPQKAHWLEELQEDKHINLAINKVPEFESIDELNTWLRSDHN